MGGSTRKIKKARKIRKIRKSAFGEGTRVARSRLAEARRLSLLIIALLH